jgi:hypothetical protein
MRLQINVTIQEMSIAQSDPVPLNTILNRPKLNAVASTAIRSPVLISSQLMRYEIVGDSNFR